MAQQVKPVSGFPNAEAGYRLGVSACYAGRIGPWLIVAGGCNFPEPGRKHYYRGIYAARVDADTLRWQQVGELPEAAAYGGVATSGDSLLLIGGNNLTHSLNTVLSLHISPDGSQATIKPLTPLPHTADNMAIAQSDNDIFVVGGNLDGRPSANILRTRLGKKSEPWSRFATLPGQPRVQPVAVCVGRKLYIWGGFHADGENSAVHTDGECIALRSGKSTALPAPTDSSGHPLTLSGGTAWAVDGTIWTAGGVNHDIFLDAISGRYQLVEQKDYLNQPIAWYRFNPRLCQYNPRRQRWQSTHTSHPMLARAGAAALWVRGFGCFYIGGELKPAVRTPQIVRIENRY
jgi:cyclically-permuted mutarotase family protein